MFHPIKTLFWKYHQLILAAFLLLFVFIKLGQHPIYPWDEARTGVNAIEMLLNHDWVNLHYGGSLDTWNAKPPFVAWCVAASFSIFGFNEFSLRLPSAISILLAFFFIYKIIRLYKSENFAFWACMVLMTGKGLIGWHVGRTGDHDAMLTFMLLAGLYFFLLWFDFDKKNKIYLAGLLFGIAFLVKGPAMVVYFPGIVLYAIITGRFLGLLRSKKTWLSLLICGLMPMAWLVIDMKYSDLHTSSDFVVDIFDSLYASGVWDLFTQNEDGYKQAYNIGFFFYSVDKTLNI